MKPNTEANRQRLMNQGNRQREQWKRDDNRSTLVEKHSNGVAELHPMEKLRSNSRHTLGEDGFIGDAELEARVRSHDDDLRRVQSEAEDRKQWSSEALEWERRNDRDALIEHERIRHADEALRLRREREEAAIRREQEIEEWRIAQEREGQPEPPKVKPKAPKPQVAFYKEKNRFVLFIERLLDRYVKRY